MNNLKTYEQFVNEDAPGAVGGGGVAFATLNANGMGNVLGSTVGTTPGSFNQSGSGQIGSGDVSAYDMGKKFGLVVNKEKKTKKNKNKKRKPRYFTKSIEQNPTL